ncbi:hypothetical protein I552_10270 [Mycobacterium xenopi 3993]|nr:hypothetical protein I552_10270 [Mycobacterium xenopi 3993]
MSRSRQVIRRNEHAIYASAAATTDAWALWPPRQRRSA